MQSLKTLDTFTFDDDIDLAGSHEMEGMKVDNIKSRGLIRIHHWWHQACRNDVHLLPKEVDEKEEKLHFLALGAALIVFTQERADFLGVKGEGNLQRDVPASRPTSEFGMRHQSSIIRDVVFQNNVLRL